MDTFKEAYKQKLLETFDFTTAFFNEHGLKWWGGYGTVLGAVRHKGLIPWDDDIDLYMLRADYNKLLALRSYAQKMGYDIKSALNKEHYNSFIKICNQSTSLVANQNYLFDEGVFIDIFPVDFFEGNIKDFERIYEQQRKLTRLYKLTCMTVTPKMLACNLIHFKFSLLGRQILKLLIPAFFKEKIWKSIVDFNNKMSTVSDGDCYTSFLGPYKTKELLKKEWFDGYRELDYEGRKIRVPVDYDAYLTHLYGDYMTPPAIIPKSTHGQYYVNLLNKMNMSEIKNKVSQGITKEY